MEVQMGRREKKQRRIHTPEFKADAVKLARASSRTVTEIAHELDIAPSLLGRWIRQADIDEGNGPEGALTTTEKEELQRLRRENKELRMEKEILKKAAAFFAKENS
jgi:transposase